MDMNALLEELSALLQKINSGTASLGELEAFAAATGQLNERAIILKYKAYEAKVYGLPVEKVVETTPETPTPVAEPELLVANDVLPVVEVVHTEVEEEPSDISFDLFSMTEEETEETSTQQEETEEELAVEEEIIAAESVQEEAEMEVEFTTAHEMEDEEEVSLFAQAAAVTEDPIEPAISQDMPTEEVAVIEEEKVEETIMETPIEPIVEPTPAPTPSSFSGNEHPILKKALINDGSLQSRMLNVRIESLKGAFGLNERMQIVQSLFGGSNELYLQVIEQLDNCGSKAEARSIVSDLANRYTWKEDNELAIEFVQKVERRHA